MCQFRAKKCHTGHTNYFGIITRKAACHCEVASEEQTVLWTFAAKQPAVAGTDDSDHPTVIARRSSVVPPPSLRGGQRPSHCHCEEVISRPTVIARRTIVRRGNLIPDPQIATDSMKPRNDTLLLGECGRYIRKKGSPKTSFGGAQWDSNPRHSEPQSDALTN